MTRTSNRFSRRRFMHNAGLAMAAAAAGKTLLPRVISPARASGSDNVIRALGVTTGAPDSWDEFEKATGFKVEWTPIGDDVGLFLHEMIGNDGGERYDLVTSLSGTYETLADQQLLMPVDTAKLKNWSGVSDLIRTATPQAPDGQGAWSVPFQFNADSFAYFPKALGEPDAPAEVSWSLLYDDKRTLGKSALDNGIYALLCCAIYLKHHGLVQIDDIANLTATQGYLTPRPDLGLTYAQEKGWDGARVAEIQNAIKKLDQKFLKKLFWDPGYFKNMEIYEREVARFKNA